MTAVPGAGWLVRELGAREERWLPVEFFIFIEAPQGVAVVALALIDGQLTTCVGRLKRAES